MATVAEGKRDPSSVTEVVVWEADWLCTDYAAAGLVLCESLAKRVEALAREDSDHHADDSSDQDAEAREAAAAEAQRRERRKVIALNKLGEAAQQVRRQFITDKILTRQTAPTGSAMFVAACLPRDVRLIAEPHGGPHQPQLPGASHAAAGNDRYSGGSGKRGAE